MRPKYKFGGGGQRKKSCGEGERQSDNDGLAELSELELLKDLGGGEDEGVDDAGDGEGAADDGADRRQEVVQRRPRLVVLDRYRIQIIPEERMFG